MQLFRNRVERLSISIGNALMPAMTSIMETLAPMVDRLSDLAVAYPKVTAAVVAATAGLVAFRIATIGAAFAAGTLRSGALMAGIVGMRGIGAAAAIASAALWPLRASLAAAGRAMALFALSARIGGIGTALSAVGASALAMLNPLRLATATIRGVGVALRFAFIGSGVGAVIAGIAAAGTFIYHNWDGIGEMFKSFGDAFMTALGPARPLVEGFATAISTISDKVMNILGPLDQSGASWRAWGETLGEIAGGGVASLISGIDKIGAAIGWVIDKAKAGADALASFFGAGANSSPGQLGTPTGSYKPEPGYTPPPGISGARASGGNVYAGGLYRVNEFGQEFFSPEQNGRVHPANAARRTPDIFGPGRSSGTGSGSATSGRQRAGNIGPITFNITGSNANEIAGRVSSELSGVFADYGLDFD